MIRPQVVSIGRVGVVTSSSVVFSSRPAGRRTLIFACRSITPCEYAISASVREANAIPSPSRSGCISVI